MSNLMCESKALPHMLNVYLEIYNSPGSIYPKIENKKKEGPWVGGGGGEAEIGWRCTMVAILISIDEWYFFSVICV